MISTRDKQSCLQSCPLFAGLDASVLAVLAESVDTEVYADGEDVCLHGEEADRAYVVMDGSLAIFLPGIKAPVRRLGPGEIVGEYGLFAGTRTATLRADGPTTLLSVDYTRFRAFLFQYPNAMFKVLAVTVRRLTESEARLRARDSLPPASAPG